MQPTTKTTDQVIYFDRDHNPLPDKHGAVGGEIVATFPDGTVEHTMFTLSEPTPQP